MNLRDLIIIPSYPHLWANKGIYEYLLLISGLLFPTVINCNVNAVEETSYRLGIFPHMSTIRLEKKYSPIAVSFSKILNKPVRLGTATSLKKFRSRLKKGDFDVALISPFDIVPVVDMAGYIPLARRPSTSAAIIVIEDSLIKNTGDLLGKKIGLPEGTPVSIFLQLSLKEQGFVKGRDIFFQNFKNVPSCLHQLLLNKVDACGRASGVGLKMFQNKTGIRVREIIKTRTFPHMLYVAHPRVPYSMREKLKNALTGKLETVKKKTSLPVSSNNINYIQYKKTDYDIIRKYRKRWMNDAKNSL